MKDEKYLSNLIDAFETTVSTQIEKQISELGGEVRAMEQHWSQSIIPPIKLLMS
tara:strand:+ start:331 stop:492 length:162 start_codon:yes stop_codon:yes gene_type:complete